MMMLCSVGTHVLESLSEIGSFRGRKKSRSSFRWSNRSHFARTVGKGDEFTQFEYEGWQRARCGKIQCCLVVTDPAIHSLLDRCCSSFNFETHLVEWDVP